MTQKAGAHNVAATSHEGYETTATLWTPWLIHTLPQPPSSRPVLPPGKRQRSRSVQLFLGGRPEPHAHHLN